MKAADATIVRNRSEQATDSTNYSSDFNLDGFVNSADATLARGSSGSALPGSKTSRAQ